jgi:glycosyltransferase involved in cell wall biosynthesis
VVRENSPPVSIIVPIHNDERGAAVLLECLEQQTAPKSAFELLFVDDMSTDATARVIEASSIARLLRAPTHGGSYAARNFAIAHARGELLAFTDGDCAPSPGWISRGIELMRDATVDMIAGRIEVPIGDQPTIAILLDAGLFFDQERYVRDGFAATANLWVRRQVIERVGRFNDTLLSGGDKDFGLRATGAGATLHYDEDLVVGHRPRARLREIARKSHRIGLGAADHVYRTSGPLSKRPRPWAHPRGYLPSKGPATSVSRLRRMGFELSRWEEMRLYWAEYLASQLPSVVGGLRGALATRRS